MTKDYGALIRNIQQKDNHTFFIEWSDGKKIDYRLDELQKKCPCAQCVEHGSLQKTKDVRATRIVNVGRYALRIQFTSGCSAGIYDFDMLRSIV